MGNIYRLLDFYAVQGQQKETQYPGWHKDTTGKEFWSGKDNEVPQGARCLRKCENDSWMRAVSYSHWWLWH